MTPSVSTSATGYVPALAGNDWNSLQYLLRTGPANSMASFSTIYISSQERKCQYLKHRQFGRGRNEGRTEGREGGRTGGRDDGRTVLSWSPRKYQRKLRCRRKSRLNKTGSGPGHPVAGKIRVPGSAQAPSVPLNISPSVVLRTPCADLRSACHGGVVGCRNRASLSEIVGTSTHQKSSP